MKSTGQKRNALITGEVFPLEKITIAHLTRGNTYEANRAIESLYYSAENKDCLEVIVILDEDDSESIDYFSSQLIYKPKLHLTAPKGGFGHFHEYFNEVIFSITGTWFIPWSDDCIMITGGWDRILQKGVGTDLLYSFYDVSIYGTWYTRKNDSILLLAVSSELLNIMGSLSPHHALDSFWEQVAYPLGIVSKAPQITIFHYGMDEPWRSKKLAKWAKTPLPELDAAQVSHYILKLKNALPFARRVRIYFKNLGPNITRLLNLTRKRFKGYLYLVISRS